MTQTAGEDLKLPVPASFVMTPAVPLYEVSLRMYLRASSPLSTR